MPWLTIDLGLWTLLAVVWVAAAPFARKTVRKETWQSRARYIVPAIVCGVLLSRDLVRLPWLDARWLPADAWVGALSVAMTALGIGFAAWARFTLGRNWSGTVTVKENHELVRTGPYGVTRHPIYTGALVAMLGVVIAAGTARAALVMVVAIGLLRLKMRVEERFMSEQFGEQYATYRRDVKGLVPFLW